MAKAFTAKQATRFIADAFKVISPSLRPARKRWDTLSLPGGSTRSSASCRFPSWEGPGVGSSEKTQLATKKHRKHKRRNALQIRG